MTLVEIKTKVPELQTKIADLAKLNADSNKRLSEIETEIGEIQALKKIQEDAVKSYDDLISQYESSSSSRMQTAVKEYKKKKDAANRVIKTHQNDIKKLEDEKKEITKPDSDYSKRATELANVKQELDQICDILVQDPTINYHMQTAVMVKFDDEIEKQKLQKESNQKTSKDIGKSLQDDSKDGLKTLMDELITAKKELDASLDDPSKDSQAAKIKHLDVRKKLVDQIKTKFGVDVKPMDIEYMMSAVDSKQLDDLSIPSLELASKKIDSVIEKLEQSREKTLAAIEAKKVVGDVVATPEMEENQKDIERLTGEVDGLTSEIETIDTELAELDKQIKDKEEELGDPSEDYVELKDAEKNLKENNIITTDALPDLLDEKSELSKKYEEFEKADLAVRQAFQACKTPTEDGFLDNKKPEERRNEAVDKLKQAISNYQKVAEELRDLSGYDPEAWQNYLAEDINSRVMDKESIDEAYYHTNDKNFKDMLDDKDVMNGGKAIDEYEAVEESLNKINEAQNKILKGKFDLPVEDLFKDPDKGYYKLMDDFQKASGLEKATNGNVTVYDVMKNSYLVEKKPLSRIKGFFQRIASKFKVNKPFDIPGDRQEAIERYQDAKHAYGVEEEIESRKELEDLKSKRASLIAKRDAKTSEKIGKEVELTQAEERKVELEKSAPARVSKIEATEIDIRKMTYTDGFIQEAVDRVQRDLDEDGR